MHLLLCTTPDQLPYASSLSTLSSAVGHKLSVTAVTPTTLSELHIAAKAANIDAFIISNEALLNRALSALPDYIEPRTSKKASLNDYHGSFIRLKDMDALVLNPPEQLRTVSSAPHVFNRMLSKLTQPDRWFVPTEFTWKLGTPEVIEVMYERFKEAKFIAVDIETPVPNPNRTISMVGFCAYFADTHTSETIVIPFDSMFNVAWIRKFCALEASKIMQGGRYDAAYLMRFACPPHNYLFDTMAMFHCWYSELPKRLDFISVYALRKVRYWKDDGKNGNLEDMYRYNAMDCWATLNSMLSLMREMPEYAIQNYLQEFPMMFPAIHCELEGWAVDKERFFVAKKQQEDIVTAKLTSLRKMVDNPHFNPNSSPQKLKLLQVLGCGDLTSSNEINLKKAAYRHPLNAIIIETMTDVVKANKLLSTYLVEEKMWNWRLFYGLLPYGTDTGRLASQESAFWCGFQIQNIPRGPIIKQFLVADTGWELFEPDMPQSEARCVAYLAGDTVLIDLVEGPTDYHSWNASKFFGVKYEDVWDQEKNAAKNKKLRDLSKRTNHGANYNMGDRVMLDTMGPKYTSEAKLLLKLPATWSLKQVCAHLLKQYEQTYPKIKKDLYQHVIRTIETTNQLVSAFGWTRHFFAKPSKNKPALNSAVAHGPQNLSVGVVNRGFYAVWREQIYGELRGIYRVKAQIHDSIPGQYKIGYKDVVVPIVLRLMTIPVKVTDVAGVERTMIIRPDAGGGAHRWSDLK